jgi:hypothetical protein
MPIRAEMKQHYPANWEFISEATRFGRAGGVCEWRGCRAVHGKPHPETGSKVVLTTAHVHNHHPSDVRPTNLLALCQLHHLRLDARLHAQSAAQTRRRKSPQLDILDG